MVKRKKCASTGLVHRASNANQRICLKPFSRHKWFVDPTFESIVRSMQENGKKYTKFESLYIHRLANDN